MIFFTGGSEAERYARNRPYFHPLAIAKFKEATGLDGPVLLALDVACGTGQSAVSLTAIAHQVIGIDISWHMLMNAERDERLGYIQARAEAIPLPGASLPLMSTALAFHWFGRDQFLREAWRVLAAGGRLLIYNNGFTGSMIEDPAFRDWSYGAYPERFPTPPRDSRPITPEEMASYGFELIDQERYENEVSFTPEELAAYLATQTNVVAALEEGRENLESANQWLLEQIRPYFAASRATFVFATRAWYLRKEAVH